MDERGIDRFSLDVLMLEQRLDLMIDAMIPAGDTDKHDRDPSEERHQEFNLTDEPTVCDVLTP
ncbi:MAG TPA: hypothetical protein VN894_09775, partial [Polyangiaceae bacterium]|nr:hypothetical protein [Polyangiaceae bacterium]